EDRVHHILVLSVDLPVRFGIHADDWTTEQVSHYIEIVRRQIGYHADVTDSGGEGTQAQRPDLEDPAQVSRIEVPFQLSDGRIEPLDLPNGESQALLLRNRDHLPRLSKVGRNGLLDQDVAALF